MSKRELRTRQRILRLTPSEDKRFAQMLGFHGKFTWSSLIVEGLEHLFNVFNWEQTRKKIKSGETKFSGRKRGKQQ